jgi:hypothetical protein
MPELTVDDLLARARLENKPVLLYFVARTSLYWGAYRRLDGFFLHPQVSSVVGTRFVFRIYQLGRGGGTAAAARFGVNTLNPVVVILSPHGDVFLRWVLESVDSIAGWDAPRFAAYLLSWARDARLSTDEVVERATSSPDDLALAQHAAQRFWARGDIPTAKYWLQRVEGSDSSTGKGAAARAAWQGVRIELAQQMSELGKTLAREYIQRFPAHAMPAARLLAAAAADPAEIHSVITGVVEKTLYGAKSEGDPAAVPADINAIVYDALEMGMVDAALVAAESQVLHDPGNPNAYDTLAQVHAARGSYDQAIASAERGLALADRLSPIADTLRSTISEANTSSSVQLSYSCRRRLLEPLLIFSGENLLFVNDELQSTVRRGLESPVAKIALECLRGENAPNELVVIVRFGEDETIVDLEVITESVSAEAARCLRQRVVGLPAPMNAPGVEVILTVSLSRV